MTPRVPTSSGQSSRKNEDAPDYHPERLQAPRVRLRRTTHPQKQQKFGQNARTFVLLREVHRCAPAPPIKIALCFQAFATRETPHDTGRGSHYRMFGDFSRMCRKAPKKVLVSDFGNFGRSKQMRHDTRQILARNDMPSVTSKRIVNQ